MIGRSNGYISVSGMMTPTIPAQEGQRLIAQLRLLFVLNPPPNDSLGTEPLPWVSVSIRTILH